MTGSPDSYREPVLLKHTEMNKTANTGITMTDVRNEAFDAIQKLKRGELDVKTAAEIRNLCGVVIDVAKTQVEFIKAIPNSVKEQMSVIEVKAIAGTLRDRDAEFDEVMHEVETSQGIKSPHQTSPARGRLKELPIEPRERRIG